MSSKMKNIVILGGSYSALSMAHRILKKAGEIDPCKVTVVCPNTHLYWNMASPRGIIPGQYTDDKLFQPIAPGFSQYPTERFELVHASAETLDVKTRRIEVVGQAIGNKTLEYDILILATGTRTKLDTPLKMLNSTEKTMAALRDYQARVKESRTIVVAGAGVTGVETVGELAFEYGQQKRIILIAGGATILDDKPSSVSKTALKDLKHLKVDIKLQSKVLGSVKLPNGQQTLTLSSGEELTTDMYIPTFGLVPNTAYLSSDFLNAEGYVVVDTYLKVKGAEDVWAIGDVSSAEPSEYMPTQRQAAYLAKNISFILSGRTPPPYTVSTIRFTALQIGKDTGTGHFGRVKIPGFIVKRVRWNLFAERLESSIDGSFFMYNIASFPALTLGGNS